jgi:hypothetical protein
MLWRKLLIQVLRLRIRFRDAMIKELRRSDECTSDVALLRARNNDDYTRVVKLKRTLGDACDSNAPKIG